MGTLSSGCSWFYDTYNIQASRNAVGVVLKLSSLTIQGKCHKEQARKGMQSDHALMNQRLT